MTSKTATLTLIALLGPVGTFSALADNDRSERGARYWTERVATTESRPNQGQMAPLGYAVSGGAARVVNVEPGAKYLNVTRLETVQINVAGKTIIWKFDTLGTAPFPLSKIIPGVEGVTVYVAENPSYQGG